MQSKSITMVPAPLHLPLLQLLQLLHAVLQTLVIPMKLLDQNRQIQSVGLRIKRTMDRWLQNFFQETKENNGKNQTVSKRAKPTLDPWRQLLVDTALLGVENSRFKRSAMAGFSHTASYKTPHPKVLDKAIEMTIRTRGMEASRAAAASWNSLITELVVDPDVPDSPSKKVLTKYSKEATNIEEHVRACRVVISFDKKKVLVTYWVRDLAPVEKALQDVLVSIGGEIKHDPAPPMQRERSVIDDLQICLGGKGYKGAGKSASSRTVI